MTKLEAVAELTDRRHRRGAGADRAARCSPTRTSHQRNMLVEMDRPDGVEAPVVIPGNPVKLSKVAEGPESRVPWLGEHTRSVLHDELGLDDAGVDQLVADGVVTD